MNIFKKFKSRPAVTITSDAMIKSLRTNADGLEQAHGKKAYIDRMRQAADKLEDYELALILIAANTRDMWAAKQAEDALRM